MTSIVEGRGELGLTGVWRLHHESNFQDMFHIKVPLLNFVDASDYSASEVLWNLGL